MTLRILLIAAAAMICLCAADVAHINQAAPKDVLVPFNDLLPPPLEESSSTTEAATTPATKPTKKSFFQQQARAKETNILAEEPISKPELALDLLPPFEETVSNDVTVSTSDSSISSTTTISTTTTFPTTTTTTTRTSTTQRPTTSTARNVPHVAQPQQLHARANSFVVSESSASSRFSADLIRQYATYFQSTTPRPPRGPLPTLTPFPRYIKK